MKGRTHEGAWLSTCGKMVIFSSVSASCLMRLSFQAPSFMYVTVISHVVCDCYFQASSILHFVSMTLINDCVVITISSVYCTDEFLEVKSCDDQAADLYLEKLYLLKRSNLLVFTSAVWLMLGHASMLPPHRVILPLFSGAFPKKLTFQALKLACKKYNFRSK